MRVIGGEFRSRRLKTLHGGALRPTPDILREALFDVLQTRVEGCVFVDAYAGSGAVGIEALSRGAARAIFLEKRRAAVRVIQENLSALGLDARATVAAGKVSTLLARFPGDIVFLDPPYPLEHEYPAALEILGKGTQTLVLVQHDKRLKLKESYGSIVKMRILSHGDNAITFYAPPSGP